MRAIDAPADINSNRLYVRLLEKDAQRPTLVFLHDSLGCTTLWRDFPDGLAEATGCNLLVYDRRGYGKSEAMPCAPRTTRYLEDEADTLHHLLDALHIHQAILFGHSDGGSIALIAAAKYPVRIAAVISEAAHIFVEPETLDGIRAAQKSYRETDLKHRLAKYHGDKTEAVFHAWTDTWLSEDFRSWNIEPFLPRITCPVLVIQGERDEYGTLKQVEGISKGTRGKCAVLILPRIGHTPHKEAPQQTARRAQEFIEELLAARCNDKSR